MIYTKQGFGLELRKRISLGHSSAQIGKWAHSVYSDYYQDLEPDLKPIVERLSLMADGNEFEYSKEELSEISEKLLIESLHNYSGSRSDINKAYTKEQFGIELKQKISLGYTPKQIGQWAFSIYFNYCRDLEPTLKELIQKLALMEEGPEFEYSKEQLLAISQELISGNIGDN